MSRPQFIVLLLTCILYVSNSYSQTPDKLSVIRQLIAKGEIDLAYSKIKYIKDQDVAIADKPEFYMLKAKIFEGKNNDDLAFQNYVLSKNAYSEAGDRDLAMDINLDIAYLIFSNEKTRNDYKKYFDEYYKYALKLKDSVKLAKAHQLSATFLMETKKFKQSLAEFKKAINLNNGKDKSLEAGTRHNISTLYNEYLNKPDSALYYLRLNLKYVLKHPDNTKLCYNYINQAASFYYLEDYNASLIYLKKADSIPIKHTVLKTKQCIYNFMSVNYSDINDYENAYKYSELSKQYSDSINTTKQDIAISDIEAKYQTKLFKQNAKTNLILVYTFLGILVTTIVIGWLIVKNARRREKIAAQDKLIEQQKLEKALKDYELQSIDLMLEGQEKERERIANDLHDNLGSMLATLKLNFENLKLRKNELAGEENKLYERTDELIEEAYQKVRRIAHAKNAGVIANKGLLPAIKKLAEKLTLPGKLNIQVVDFGFDERLENTLEIAIFRMVQELATNIIKHSLATEATIHLTHHQDNINIIIEDNGVGFNQDEVAVDGGMGLDSIRKKATQLGGTLTIDATPGKGTTIVIDIPV